MAIATTFALVFLFTRVSRTGWLDRMIAEDVPVALLAVPVSIGAMLVWTMVGLALGLLWVAGGFESKPSGLGSESWQFAFIVVAAALLPLPPLVLFLRRYWWLWAAMSMLFAGLFGWAMPALAGR
jgi:hypothetical protein